MLQRIFFFSICISILSCKKQTNDFKPPSVLDYQPLKQGSVYWYRLDSLVTKPNSSVFEKHSYHLKDSIESQFTNNTDLINYRVYRYIRDTLDQQPWKFVLAYVLSINQHKLEMIENNLRFIKLSFPITETTVWEGNIYIDTKSSNSPFFYLNGWKYQYQNINQPFSAGKGLIQNTITVFQADETDPNEAFSPALDFHDRNYSVEVFAKNIGLIYKQYLHWTWQKNPNPGFQSNSYGITLNLIDYKP